MMLVNSNFCLLRYWSFAAWLTSTKGDRRAKPFEDELGVPFTGLLDIAIVEPADPWYPGATV